MGSFITIEGADHCGKSTQIELLTKLLDRESIRYHYIHFPRTDIPGTGELISKFLRGEFGQADQVDPYLVSVLFAADRAAAQTQLRDKLSSNELIIADRYFWSNVAFQRAKVPTIEAKNNIQSFLERLELTTLNIIKPDLSLYLKMPLSFILNGNELRRGNSNRSYLNGEVDIHETDSGLQERVINEYDRLAVTEPNFKLVACHDAKNVILSKESIHETIVKILVANKIIPPHISSQ